MGFPSEVFFFPKINKGLLCVASCLEISPSNFHRDFSQESRFKTAFESTEHWEKMNQLPESKDIN